LQVYPELVEGHPRTTSILFSYL